jgi:hypothetical protein
LREVTETRVIRADRLANGVHRSWNSLGHGFGYLDSFGDTGMTQVPVLPRIHGSTGRFGDPRWETLDRDEVFCVFAVAPVIRSLTLGFDQAAAERFDSVVVLPPPQISSRELRRSVEDRLGIALEEVLNGLRAVAALPVGDLAAMLGVSRRQFYNWLARENEPDTEQEQRIRKTARMIQELFGTMRAPRQVRATLLESTDLGTAYDAFKRGELELAERIIALVIAGESAPTEAIAPNQRFEYDREQVLLEMEHQRDVPRRG